MTGCFASVGRSASPNLPSIRDVPSGKVVPRRRQRIERKSLRCLGSEFDGVLAFSHLIASSRESGDSSCKLSETAQKLSYCTCSTVECNVFSRYIGFFAFTITNFTKAARYPNLFFRVYKFGAVCMTRIRVALGSLQKVVLNSIRASRTVKGILFTLNLSGGK